MAAKNLNRRFSKAINLIPLCPSMRAASIATIVDDESESTSMGENVSRQNKNRGFDERKIAFLRPRDLKLNPRNARVHPEQQIEQIAQSINQFGFNNPVLVDGQDNVLAGEGRVKAARRLGLQQIPALKIEHLNAAEKRAFVLADNKLAEGSGWSSEF